MMKNSKLKTIFLRLTKIVFSNLIFYSGLILFIKKIGSYKGGVKILTFHRINDDSFDPVEMNIKVGIFEKLIGYLKEKYTIISLQNAIELIDSGESIPKSAIILTFDDGYRDNYLNAFPILKKYRVPATIFLTVGAIDTGGILWWDSIGEAFKRTDKAYEDKLKTAREVILSAKYLGKDEREALVKSMGEKLGVDLTDNTDSVSMLSWEDIKNMSNNGISFGSHGMSHSILTTLSPEDAKFEIAESKKIIKEKTGLDVKIFSYPNGSEKDFNEDIIQMLRNNRYIAACSLMRGVNNNVSLMALRRYYVGQEMITDLSGEFSATLFEMEMLR